VLKLYEELGIKSLAELEQAALDDRVKAVKGLGASLQAKILTNIQIAKTGETRLHMHRADALLRSAANRLTHARPEVKSVTIAGDLRRGCELVTDLSLVAAMKNAPDGLELGASSGLKVFFTSQAEYGATLLHATGSAGHWKSLQSLAERKSFRLDEHGLWKGAKRIAGRTEEEIYQKLDLAFVPPELREGADEIDQAAADSLPKLVADADIKGVLHAHTDASDGSDTLKVMAEATRKRGYEYFGVADHSKSAHYAGGLSLEEINEQHGDIDELNKACGKTFRIFKGIESDILADGSLDYADEVLDRFDFVVASVHSRFKMTAKEQTERILRAVGNRYTTILGHMTGRQLLRRPSYDLDIEKVLRACAKHGVAVEVNANPWRLDLDWRWHRRALELGCMLSINPDAHSTDEIALTHWGVQIARKGGVSRDRVLNCLTLPAITRYFKTRRAQSQKRTKLSGRPSTSSVRQSTS